ncbi:hypothetical protein N7491_001858 [Penicillium cf. griseofulvum]|uniref:Phosphoglycerate mutase family protein n=1 Tax=Penicillium cf. griseofulvum TaxID=2972120 RepID=A0A9W9T2Z0_9EURO|nr:hypothetical protein N7472_003961 [Penicillium cf. griseofulvum]KAJ5445776.1 hypothetical protein N7491_001858 [Penicillium cf. griseofulvum]KAJ5447498.1 hypothetical protein N7445_002319 [Penicillium cf. griseofulvum]
MLGFLPVGLLAFASVAAASCGPTVYFIRHGEKPEDGGNGLNTQGLERAKCIREVFGKKSEYNIGHIMAQTPKSSTVTPSPCVLSTKYIDQGANVSDIDGKRARPRDTVKPLAEDLGLKVDIDCDRDDPKCVKKFIENYDGEGNILICWEHDTITDILETLGVQDAPHYPDDRFDLIWTVPSPWDKITEETSEHCPGLDH